jgi:uncharacterized protein GlcG (DUF336 family)
MSRTKSLRVIVTAAVVCISLMAAVSAYAQTEITVVFHKDKDSSDCGAVPNYATLKAALDTAVQDETSGLNLQMWATVVNRDGIVCAVAFSGKDRGAQWPGSRVISAQKANTANSFSLDGSSTSNASGTGAGPLQSPGGLALSTANLYSAVQPGGSLFGLQQSNPVDVDIAYDGPSSTFGTSNDPMIGGKVGGVNVFGGGLALYTIGKKIIGAVGLSGDTSCADHFIAWRVRNLLKMDHLADTFPASGDAARPDNIVFDFAPNANGGPTSASAGGFGHPKCPFTGDPSQLPAVQP